MKTICHFLHPSKYQDERKKERVKEERNAKEEKGEKTLWGKRWKDNGKERKVKEEKESGKEKVTEVE